MYHAVNKANFRTIAWHLVYISDTHFTVIIMHIAPRGFFEVLSLSLARESRGRKGMKLRVYFAKKMSRLSDF